MELFDVVGVAVEFLLLTAAFTKVFHLVFTHWHGLDFLNNQE